jgi:hypothetical protein
MRTKLKLLLVLASLGALAALAMTSPAAAGGPAPAVMDPQTTNVPYVAWVGEKVRLVKCVDADTHGLGGFGDFNTVDWSGFNGIEPSYFPSNAQSRPGFAGLGEQEGRTCYDIIVASEKPGLAKIKLETRGSGQNFTHDFLVIWMTMNAPTLDELGSNEIPGLVTGDPAGDGIFAPVDCSPAAGFQGCFQNGYFQVDVTGSFPLGNNYAGDVPGDTATLPRDWATLAALYGTSAADAEDTSGWDIHDDQIDQVENPAADHSVSAICSGLNLLLDEVDNCLGGGETGTFSRLIGGTNPTVGPFDPLRPNSSYLPDGKIDAGDAPMPALRIDVGVTGAFGALAAADKHVIYSRNATGAASAAFPNNAHNLYAPFYAAYIPATAAPQTSSGVYGEAANNFPGFLTNGQYHYWNLLNTTNLPTTSNTCRDVGGTGQVPIGGGSGAIIHPRGFASASVYTDEHGEAIVAFTPDVGLRLTADSNNRCDLGEIGGLHPLAGTATISAQAELPFEQAQRPINATPLTKQLMHLAGKSLDCVPKSANEAFCVETILDIRGNPVVGAEVSFTREARGLIIPGAIALGGFNTTGQTVLATTTSDDVRILTNARGQAGVEVKSTLPGLVDLDAENVGTRNGGFGVQRVRCIRFFGDGVTQPTDSATCAAAPVVTPPPGGGTGGGGGGGGTGGGSPAPPASSTATVVSLAGAPVPAAQAPAVKPAAKAAALKLTSARLVFKNGTRYLVVRVNGAAKTAKVQITLVMRTGKATKPVVRSIATNRAVRVANLQVGKHVRTVRVALAK